MSKAMKRKLHRVTVLLVAAGVAAIAPLVAAAEPNSSDEKSDQTPERAIVIQGTVLDDGGSPVSAARLFLSVDEWTDPRELGTSDEHGRYRFEVSESTLVRTQNSNFSIGRCMASLVAVAAGHGAGWVELPDKKGGRFGQMQSEYRQDLKLARDARIAGQVVDYDGKPIAGAAVSVSRIHDLSDGRWWKMLPAIAANDIDRLTKEEADVNNWFSPLYPTAWHIFPAARTDESGKFEIIGVGVDRAITLSVSGPGVHNKLVSVLTRDDVTDFTRRIRERYPHTLREPNGEFYPEPRRHARIDPSSPLGR